MLKILMIYHIDFPGHTQVFYRQPYHAIPVK